MKFKIQWGGLGRLGGTYNTQALVSVSVYLCNRSHVSTFVHALESQASSGNDQGGIDLSLLSSFMLKVMLTE